MSFRDLCSDSVNRFVLIAIAIRNNETHRQVAKILSKRNEGNQ